MSRIAIQPDQIGRLAAELLVARVEGKDAVPPTPDPTRIVTRTSTRRRAVKATDA